MTSLGSWNSYPRYVTSHLSSHSFPCYYAWLYTPGVASYAPPTYLILTESVAVNSHADSHH